MSLWIFVYSFCMNIYFQFSWVFHPGVEFLGCMVRIGITFWGNADCLRSSGAVWLAASSIWGLQFLYIPTNTCYFLVLYLSCFCVIAILVGVGQYLVYTLVLAYISSSLMTWMLNIFSGAYWPFGTSILKMSCLINGCVHGSSSFIGGGGWCLRSSDLSSCW